MSDCQDRFLRKNNSCFTEQIYVKYKITAEIVLTAGAAA
jgi:hypothetical protein